MNRDKIWYLFARKLTAEASKEELHELEQLVLEDSSLHYELKAITHLWEKEPQQDAEYLEATYHLHYEKMKKLGFEPGISEEKEKKQYPNHISFLSGVKMKVAAIGFLSVIIIIIAVTVVFLKNTEKAPLIVEGKAWVLKNEVVVKRGSNTQFKLPDGSTVWLNAGSKLNYDKINESGLREVYLTGEGYFDIVRNTERPFIIHTSTIDIKVLGTKFNVKAYPDDKTVETSLIHGSVEVVVKSRPQEIYLLKPNQKLVLMNEAYGLKTVKEQRILTASIPIVTIKKLSYLNGDTSAVETSWIKNKLSFEEESFTDLAKRLERWYDVEINFRNREIGEESFSGSFETETLKQALEAIRFSNNFRFNYKIEGKNVVIY